MGGEVGWKEGRLGKRISEFLFFASPPPFPFTPATEAAVKLINLTNSTLRGSRKACRKPQKCVVEQIAERRNLHIFFQIIILHSRIVNVAILMLLFCARNLDIFTKEKCLCSILHSVRKRHVLTMIKLLWPFVILNSGILGFINLTYVMFMLATGSLTTGYSRFMYFARNDGKCSLSH